ncbi:protein hedgehog [Bradysia coprophila]|uniref:protein hedgehog n=1 Tax=Bradysia coprophila TaxID=38358 RepID=UPI00187DA9E6|nr:protein hedgehog [Bradysia coprophila]
MPSLFVLIIIFCTIVTVESCGPGRGIGGPRRSRQVSPLVFKQHVPNVSENTIGASGKNEGKITRHDPKFRDLVPNYNQDIIFKDEEGSGADRLMTQRCKEKLNTLSVSVMNTWPGVHLRVTEGWDEDGHHGIDSLHYEGRAVDITTSDRDRGKNGMLARLAVEAGFDWVYYESRAHVHCSVKSDSSQSSHSSGCFTGNSTVTTSTGDVKRLDELTVGEKVLSMDKQGNAVYSEVLMFLDRNEHETREFVKIATDGGATVSVTPAHLLMVWKTSLNQTKFIFAEQVEEDDFVLVNINGTLEPRRVTKVSSVMSKGVYAPLTREGTIIVNSITASCYALVDSQSIAHWSFMPVRAYNLVKHYIVDDGKTSAKTASIQNGVHWYAKTLYTIKDYLLPSDWIYQT